MMCLSHFIRKPFFNNVTRRGHILRGDKKSQVEARVSEAWLGKAKAPVGELLGASNNASAKVFPTQV